MKRTKTIKDKTNDFILDTNPDIYFISLGNKPKRWFNVNELNDIVSYGDKKNPITNAIIDEFDIKRIKFYMDKLQKNDIVSRKYDIIPLQERIDELENKIDETINNNEQIYADFVSLSEKFDTFQNN